MTYAATITQKGQVTIPVDIRNALGLETSDKLLFTIKEKKIVVEPVKNDFMSLYGSLKPKNKKQPEDLKKIRRIVTRKIGENAAKEGL